MVEVCAAQEMTLKSLQISSLKESTLSNRMNRFCLYNKTYAQCIKNLLIYDLAPPPPFPDALRGSCFIGWISNCFIFSLFQRSTYAHDEKYCQCKHDFLKNWHKHWFFCCLWFNRVFKTLTTDYEHAQTLYTEHYGRLNANHFLPKVRSQHKIMDFLHASFYAFILLSWQYFPMSILLTVVTGLRLKIYYFLSSKQIKNGSVQTNYAMLNLIDHF